jgi:hypothetical protein
MKAIGIKIKSYAENINIVEDGNLAARTLYIVFIASIVLGLSYVMILGTMVFNIVERRALESKIHTLSSEVSDLELSFLSLSNDIDLNYSHSMGFREPDVKFATRKALGSIKVNKNEI